MPLDSETAGPQQFVSEDQLTSLYGWLDEIPLSRAKRNICRDFADVSNKLFVCGCVHANTQGRDGACRVNARETLVVLDHTQKQVTCSCHRQTHTVCDQRIARAQSPQAHTTVTPSLTLHVTSLAKLHLL